MDPSRKCAFLPFPTHRTDLQPASVSDDTGMIAFDLICQNGHQFEGWFDNSDSFEEQKEKGLVTCPFCESPHVERTLSPVGFLRSGRGDTGPKLPEDPKERIIELSRQISDHIQNDYEDVGTDFTKEALKIHYGVSEARNIRGVSTPQEEKTLAEEGIRFFRFPGASDEKPDPEIE